MDIRRSAVLALAIAAGIFSLFWSGTFLPERPADLISQAEARIGRPATPVSYAGVARRTTRRSVYAGAAAATYYAPGCVQIRDANGNVVGYRCP
ncbi:hypothetical protein [Sinorhizobium americanum]|uniref:Uncharacterized protein n=1 Tax=Sinorhizobium americanum TaxID=194963 RepID=A0A4R2BZF6_9HYPH|nr:hypothetical protein [Sinorhizobium americanum]TCN33351.1 hypothetical protein EV184_103365 [Sinorhizobium americanum]